ncbi:UNVERIFIED_ORG: transposase-like protein [Methylorubrum zatmanii]|jgi:putative transposase
MPRKRFTNEQIAFALRQAENGATVDEVCRTMGVSEPTFYRWKKQFVGMGVPEIRRLKQLEDENSKLKRLVADLTLDRSMLQDVLKRKWRAGRSPDRRGCSCSCPGQSPEPRWSSSRSVLHLGFTACLAVQGGEGRTIHKGSQLRFRTRRAA